MGLIGLGTDRVNSADPPGSHESRPRVEPPFATLVDALRWRADHQPGRLAYRFLPDGDSREITMTYGDLDRRACVIATMLQSRQAAGDRTLLVYPQGLEFIAAFFGCLYAGTVAVILAPPHQARLSQFVAKAGGICQHATPSAALTTSAIHDLLAEPILQQDDMGAVPWLSTDSDLEDPALEWRAPELADGNLAFLQYTSGSTTEPRGVMVSHGNLVHNVRAIQESFVQSGDSESVSWLPPQHDMGLIGGILVPLYAGMPATLLSAVSFVQRPARWLQAISRYRATASCGPNFAYDLCVRRVTAEQRSGIDLSSWEVAFCGAEPINVQSLRDFAECFAPRGFSPSAFKLCYGLAESTLMVSAGPNRTPPIVRRFRQPELTRHQVVPCAGDDPAGCQLPSCGRPVADIVIADPDSFTECPPGQVGEIWVSGPSVAKGYWNRPVETRATFRAQLRGTGKEFLRTGDLGFLLDGELFVTGRLKDLIIIDGTNHYPQDIERTAGQCHPALAPADCAAFSVEVDGREALVVVAAPIRRSNLPVDEIRRAIRTAVAEHHDLRLHEIVLVKPGRIPKTTSGKIRRSSCRSGYLAGALDLWEPQ